MFLNLSFSKDVTIVKVRFDNILTLVLQIHKKYHFESKISETPMWWNDSDIIFEEIRVGLPILKIIKIGIEHTVWKI